MSEEIKDPNQLDLFAGILFTPEQEKMIASYVERCKNSTDLSERKNEYGVDLLIRNGFRLGVDFKNTFKRGKDTRTVTLGSRYDKTLFEAEVEIDMCGGDVELIGLRHNNGKLETSSFYLYFERDKVQCYPIQDQYRYIKPSTLLEKLHIHNEMQKAFCENYIKKNSVKQYTIEKYQKLYPNATVTAIQEYTKGMGSFDTIQVKFPSCSYVQFYIPNEIDREQVYKKHDADLQDLTAEEVLERFSKQEGSN